MLCAGYRVLGSTSRLTREVHDYVEVSPALTYDMMNIRKNRMPTSRCIFPTILPPLPKLFPNAPANGAAAKMPRSAFVKGAIV